MKKLKSVWKRIARNRLIEYLIYILVKNRPPSYFLFRFAPNNTDYKSPSIRSVKRKGLRLELDISDYMQHHIFFGIEAENHEFLFSLIKPEMVIFDIGSNIGYTALNIAKKLKGSGMVYGFEPVPENYERALKNLRLNSLKNIRIENKAVSARPETLYLPPLGSNKGAVFMMEEPSGDPREIPAITLDQFVKSNAVEKADLIKMDIEGWEYNALLGAREMIARFRPILFIETFPGFYNGERNKVSFSDLIKLLFDYGYILHNVPDMSIVEPSSIPSSQDILCVPETLR